MYKKLCGIFVLTAAVALSACGGASAGSSSASSAASVTPAAESIPATSIPTPTPTPEPTPAIAADAVEPVTLENYGQKIDELFSSEKQSISNVLDETLKAVGTDYIAYKDHKDSFTSWYEQAQEESNDVYDEAIGLTKEVYPLVAQNASADDDYDYDEVLDDIEDVFENGMSSFSAEKKIMFDRIKAYQKSIFDPENASVDEEELEEAAEQADDELSAAKEKDEDLYEDALAELRRNHEAIENGFDQGDFDVEALLQKADVSSSDEDDDQDETDEDSDDEDDPDTTDDSDTDDDNDDDSDDDDDSDSGNSSNKSDSQNSNSGNSSSDGEVDADFKSDMDSYKQFFDEYEDFKKHQEETGNTDDPGDYEQKREEYEKELDNVNKDELSDADRKYYEDTMDSINKSKSGD